MEVADDAEVGHPEDGGLLVLVDGDDVGRALHPHQVLRGAGDSAGQVHGRLHDLAGLAHLVRVGHPAGIDDRPGGAGGALEEAGQRLDQLVRLGCAEATTTRHHDGRLVQLRTGGLLGEAVLDRRAAGVAEVAGIEAADGGGATAGRLGRERLGPHEEYGGAVAGEAGGDVDGATEHGLDPEEAAAVDDQVDHVGDDRCVDLGGQAAGDVAAVVAGGGQHNVRAVAGGDGAGDGRGDPGTGQAVAQVTDGQDRGGAVLAELGGDGGSVLVFYAGLTHAAVLAKQQQADRVLQKVRDFLLHDRESFVGFKAEVELLKIELAKAAQGTPKGPFQRRKVLVTIFQRGAMDGLAAVQPLSDPLLSRLRPTLALDPRRQLVDLDGRYGLHPSLSPLARYFTEGRLGIVHGAGSPVATRSHFDAQDFMETGQPGDKRASTGWLNRATGLLGHEPETPFQAVALTPALPLSLQGPVPTLAVSNLEEFGVIGPGGMRGGAAGASLEALYAQTAGDLLSNTGREGLDAARLLESARLDRYTPENGATYPRSDLAESLRQIAQLIKADVGLEVAFAEAGGWDTHSRQGGETGSFARRGEDLAQSIAAFWTDIERFHDDVTVLTMTEFGRTPHFFAEQFDEMGCKLVIWPASSMRVAAYAMQQLYASLAETGSTQQFTESMMTRAEFYDLIGYFEYESLDESVARSAIP